jgi:heat shock protein HtpX
VSWERLVEGTESARQRFADRLAQRMVDGLVGPPGWFLRRRLDRLLAMVLALPVHLVTVGLLLFGVWLLADGENWMLRILGCVSMLAGLVTRPRVSGRPEHVARLVRTDAPELFGVLDELAIPVGTTCPDEVLVIADYNAFASRVGFRRRALGIGAPLWTAADPETRAFILGHELGHFAHRDLTQGLLVGGALETLDHWRDIATPGDASLFDIATAPIRGLIIGYQLAIYFVAAPSHRRSELFADLAAARAVGTPAGVRAMELMLAVDALDVAANRAAVHRDRPDMADVLRAAGRRSEEMRAGDRARGRAEHTRIDQSHPTTAERLRLLESRPAAEPEVALAQERMDQVDIELEPHLVAALKRLGEAYRHVW